MMIGFGYLNNMLVYMSSQTATHAFAYYVGKAIVFEHLHAFDTWLNIQKANGVNANFYKFLTPILKEYSSIRHIQDHFKVYQTEDKSIRMMPLKF